jgi:hypothetical protein
MEVAGLISGSGSSKTDRLPSGFMAALEKRVRNIVVSQDKLPELREQAVKTTFANFLNKLLDPEKRRGLDVDRKIEQLWLIFYTSAVEMLRAGKPPEDDSWMLLTDRHLALLCRLMVSILVDNEWSRERSELVNRLKSMEQKLLTHAVDITTTSSKTVEVEIPLSYEVKDMPHVLLVSRVFGISYGQLQDDVNRHRGTWTEAAALKDLKMYQQGLNFRTKNILRSDDFDTEEAYEAWKKQEVHDVSEMLFFVLQANPKLAMTNSGGPLPQLAHQSSGDSEMYQDLSRRLHEHDPNNALGTLDSFSSLNLGMEKVQDGVEIPFTFVPPDSRAFYREVIKYTVSNEVAEQSVAEVEPGVDLPFLSKKTAEFLHEIALRWRIPSFSRRILFLDAVKALYQEKSIDPFTLDRAFEYFKTTRVDKKSHRKSLGFQDLVSDWTKWTMKDLSTYQQCLSAIHDALLEDLFKALQRAYETDKGKDKLSYGIYLKIIMAHLEDDDLFRKSTSEAEFAKKLKIALSDRAQGRYRSLTTEHLPSELDEVEFYHVIQLGKAVLGLCDRIRKRFRNSPEIYGARMLDILVERVFPAYARDAKALVQQIMAGAERRGDELDIEDGFTLYRELVEIRSLHQSVLPNLDFAFDIEDDLQEFVWRYLRVIERQLVDWVDNAFKQDNFTMLNPPQPGKHIEEQRHSSSAFDIFKFFREAKQQIEDLNWANSYQNAKFLTALAKTISIGVERYCEKVEQLFAKEMERLTPEQEAMMKQTNSDKILQFAKNAMGTKEKMEPFQFLSESLVKLNDIEYSMQNLDKLEQEIGVEKCADIITRQESLVSGNITYTKPIRDERFVFTIKIIEAEDLKACDPNGYSDPYVVLGDEKQKRLLKTRTVYRNLNPRWDETVDITTQNPLQLVATVWDYDYIGDHDYVGRTSLKLDPNQFRDYMPREDWFDLDTQGRLLVRISMEGERDDIQFYFGKAFRVVKRTEREMTRNITDKLSTYIRQSLSRQRLRSLTSGGISSSVTSALSYFKAAKPIQPTPSALTRDDIVAVILPLFDYINENFAIMKQTLTDSALNTVQARLWKDVLLIMEALMVPPMSDKLSIQRPLMRAELDIIFVWLQSLYDFFHAMDPDSGMVYGVAAEVLKSQKFDDLYNLRKIYFDETADLIQMSELLAESSAAWYKEQADPTSALHSHRSVHSKNLPQSQNGMLLLPGMAPHTHALGGPGHPASLMAGASIRRRKTVMMSRNLGTMRKAKEDKRRAQLSEPRDDNVLRVLRMRPEAERYLKERARQKQRLAAQQAAEAIVRQSLAGVTGGLGRR